MKNQIVSSDLAIKLLARQYNMLKDPNCNSGKELKKQILFYMTDPDINQKLTFEDIIENSKK